MKNNKTILTEEERELLSEIYNNKYAVGPFCGMIFNEWCNNHADLDTLIQKALYARLRIRDLSKGVNKGGQANQKIPFAGVPQPKKEVQERILKENLEILKGDKIDWD